MRKSQAPSKAPPKPALPRKVLHLSRWEWLILVSTAFLISLAMTSAMAAVFWFAS
jgi:hypothetical protein